MFNNEFFPTPKSIINKMLSSVDWQQVKTILEPSAGKGNILEAITEKEKYYLNSSNYGRDKIHYDIDCIEIDPNLQHILKGKCYRVVHNDFMTYNSMKQYDLIVMNPPFSNGDKHLLKALEMQSINGGGIICLLNAETLKNPYTNARKDLQRKLTEYKATVEFIQDGFTDAERKTAVEVAMIKVLIPEQKKQSFIYEHLQQEEQYKETEEEQQTYSIINNDFIKGIVNQYNLEVKAGLSLIKEYEAMKPLILSTFTKEGTKGSPIINLSFFNGMSSYNHEDAFSINGFIKRVRSKYWKALFDNQQFMGKLTSNLKYDYNKQIDNLSNYDFSLFNIYELKIDMSKKVVKGIEETILNLFEEFSNKHHYYDEMSSNIHLYNGWKTNKAWYINTKVIIPLAGFYDMQYSWGRYKPSDYKIIDKLTDIEKSLNYLDGGLTESKDIKTQLEQAEELEITKKIPLKYFTVTFYKKGTCHIEFTNLELLKKFNIFGSQKKGWLPPSYGKSDYKNMTPEEKEVVNEFEGQEEYRKTMLNKNYYIFNSNSLAMLEDKEELTA